MPGYYRVTVKAFFMAHNEYFQPGTTYWVTPDMYNGQIPDGRNFKDLCVSAEIEPPVTQNP